MEAVREEEVKLRGGGRICESGRSDNGKMRTGVRTAVVGDSIHAVDV